MARIRTIKPEFWQDEKMLPLSDTTRLVFLGLISMADDLGRLVYNPKLIEALLFDPDGPDRSRDVRESLANLSRIARVSVGKASSGQRVLQIANWNKHQKVDKPNRSAALPEIVEVQEVTEFANDSRMIRDEFATDSRLIRDPYQRPTTYYQRPTTLIRRVNAAARSLLRRRHTRISGRMIGRGRLPHSASSGTTTPAASSTPWGLPTDQPPTPSISRTNTCRSRSRIIAGLSPKAGRRHLPRRRVAQRSC